MLDIGKDAAALANWPSEERLSALKRIIPRTLIQRILRETRRDRTYCKRLPSFFMVWFVVALGLFCRDSYRQIFRWLQRYRPGRTPGRSTFCEARHRIGVAPLRLLAERAINLLGKESTPGAFYKGMQLMAIDGFLVNVRDTPANDRAFGRPGNRSPGAFPQVRVLGLCETGSHIMWRSLIKPLRRAEIPMARCLLRYLEKDMLLMWDRNFYSYNTVAQVRQHDAHLLIRAKTGLIFQPIRHLSDGSYLAKVYPTPAHRKRDEGGIIVRLIEYTFNDPNRAGSGEKHRLLTTLLDAKRYPAKELVVLYHERWEEELVIDEVKTHQRERPVLRSETPAGIVQEIYGLLLGHYIVRAVMHESAEKLGIDPQRVSFINALKIIRCRLPECPSSPQGLNRWYENLVSEISEDILPVRRNRINPRVLKKTRTDWPPKRKHHLNYPQPQKEFRRAIVMLN